MERRINKKNCYHCMTEKSFFKNRVKNPYDTPNKEMYIKNFGAQNVREIEKQKEERSRKKRRRLKFLMK